ncbi:porin [Rhizobacter sp. AJA081-3]|uniref:porin n=1 Tax=Rhizobacter sp. AJA081-3 TaxID=2753607 RepID=UPI001ADF048E|nr:porin [Rhizobacter sp. AJA081-3]QTN24354.1 porin [Rhizobacter sp. AJA081-3]
MNRSSALRSALVAASVACALPGTAMAQSSVTLSGLLDISAGQSKAAGSSNKVWGVDNGQMTTSWFGASGSEDLGGGLSALFTLQSFMRADTGASGRFGADTFWARNAFVGLASNSLGKVTIGRNTTPFFVTTLSFNPFGDSFGYSPSIRHYFTSGTLTGDSGWSDSVLYTSPKLGGATLQLFMAAGEAGSNGRNHGVNLRWGAGAFDSAFSWQDVKKDGATPVADTKSWQAAASYDFGVARLFGQFGNVANKTSGNEYDIAGLGASVPVGNGKILAQWGQIKPETGAKRKTFSAGYDYFLSKRTDLYAVAMNDKIDGQSNGSAFSVGIRHRY